MKSLRTIYSGIALIAAAAAITTAFRFARAIDELASTSADWHPVIHRTEPIAVATLHQEPDPLRAHIASVVAVASVERVASPSIESSGNGVLAGVISKWLAESDGRVRIDPTVRPGAITACHCTKFDLTLIPVSSKE